jgi:hypothetical protein
VGKGEEWKKYSVKFYVLSVTWETRMGTRAQGKRFKGQGAEEAHRKRIGGSWCLTIHQLQLTIFDLPVLAWRGRFVFLPLPDFPSFAMSYIHLLVHRIRQIISNEIEIIKRQKICT